MTRATGAEIAEAVEVLLDVAPRFPFTDDANSQACRDSADLFEAMLPGVGVAIDPRLLASAKATCRRCPFRRECLSWAVEADEWGVWGGMTQTDRRRVAKKLRAYTGRAVMNRRDLRREGLLYA